jgi:hypothetical protein
MDIDPTRAVWHKSTFSNGSGGNCVETLKLTDGSRAVRHSQNPDGPALIFTSSEWDAFVAGVKAREFD